MRLRLANTRCGQIPVSEAKAKLMFDWPCHGLSRHAGYDTTLRNPRYPLQTADDLPPRRRQDITNRSRKRLLPLAGFEVIIVGRF